MTLLQPQGVVTELQVCLSSASLSITYSISYGPQLSAFQQYKNTTTQNHSYFSYIQPTQSRLHMTERLHRLHMLFCLVFSCVYWLKSRVLLHCNVSAGHIHYILIWLRCSHLTIKQGSPPLLSHHWPHPLIWLQTLHTAEALFRLRVGLPFHWLGSVPLSYPQMGRTSFASPLTSSSHDELDLHQLTGWRKGRGRGRHKGKWYIDWLMNILNQQVMGEPK